MKDFCVIGSGISGSTIANLLNKKYSVDVFDKARGPGGRSSFKRLKDKIGFDHGTQYISPKSINFKRFINQLIKKRVLKKWGGNHLFLNTQKKEDKKHVKIIGAKGNNDISKYLLKSISSNFQKELKKIERKDKKWILSFSDGNKKKYSNLILTCPFPQLKKLTKKIIKHSFLDQKIRMDANITVMISINKKISTESSYFFDDPILGWAANENTKKRLV
jgi:renalase